MNVSNMIQGARFCAKYVSQEEANNMLLTAVKSDNANDVMYAIDKGADVNCFTNEMTEHSLLFYTKSYDVLDILIKHGININTEPFNSFDEEFDEVPEEEYGDDISAYIRSESIKLSYLEHYIYRFVDDKRVDCIELLLKNGMRLENISEMYVVFIVRLLSNNIEMLIHIFNNYTFRLIPNNISYILFLENIDIDVINKNKHLFDFNLINHEFQTPLSHFIKHGFKNLGVLEMLLSNGASVDCLVSEHKESFIEYTENIRNVSPDIGYLLFKYNVLHFL